MPGFGPVPRPFAFSTSRESPTANTPLGYHPTGIRHSRPSFPLPADKPKTATALLSASATNRRVPSFERARAFGLLPSEGPEGGGSGSVLLTLNRAVSTTATLPVLAEATNSRVPAALSRR